MFIQFYEHLFTSGNSDGMEECLTGLEVRVTSAMNEQLLPKVVANEVDIALSQI